MGTYAFSLEGENLESVVGGLLKGKKATLALVERASELLGSSVSTTALEIAAASYERQVSEVVESDDDVSEYVHRLEETSDDGDEDDEEMELTSGDALAADFERYLREQQGD